MALFVKALGEGEDTIVLLHGFGGSHEAWSKIQPALAEKHSTLAYDLPGHGGSFDYPKAGSAKVAAQAILADLKEKNLQNVHIVGHSMGGAIATLIAMFDSELVASLTLLAPGGYGPEINHRLLTRYAQAKDAETIASCLEAMTGWFSPIPEERVTQALAARQGEGRHEKLIEMAEGLARDGMQGQIPTESVEALEMPVCVVWGELDNVLPIRQARNLPVTFDGHVFSNLGHMLPDEAPEEITEIISMQVVLYHNDL